MLVTRDKGKRKVQLQRGEISVLIKCQSLIANIRDETEAPHSDLAVRILFDIDNLIGQLTIPQNGTPRPTKDEDGETQDKTQTGT